MHGRPRGRPELQRHLYKWQGHTDLYAAGARAGGTHGNNGLDETVPVLDKVRDASYFFGECTGLGQPDFHFPIFTGRIIEVEFNTSPIRVRRRGGRSVHRGTGQVA